MDAEEIAQQQALLETYRRTLAVYIQQQATIGRAYSPPALINGIAETRSEIKRIKALLQAANVPVSSDPDDDEPPPPIIVVQRADQRWIWLGGAAGLLGLILLLVVVLRTMTAIPSTPGSTALAQATQLATPSASNTLLFSDDFSHGRIDTWTGNSDEWSLVQDAAQTLYQGQVVSDSSADSNPISFYNELDDYALEIRIRISNIGADDDIPDFWFTLRANSPPANGCEGYAFNYYGVSQTAVISRLGSEPCPFKLLTRQALVLKPGEWHTIRAEVRGSQQRYLVDNRLVAEASDDSLKKGFFYISVGKGAVIQFSNVRVFSLAEPTQ